MEGGQGRRREEEEVGVVPVASAAVVASLGFRSAAFLAHLAASL